MIVAYILKLNLSIQKISLGAQKFNGIVLEIFDMLKTKLFIKGNLEKVWIFKKTFLLAKISMEIVLEMPFLFSSNADIQFDTKELIWRFYTVAKVLPTTSRVQLIVKREFAKTALDENSNTFMMYMAVLDENSNTFIIYMVALKVKMLIHSNKAVQIAVLQ